MRLPRTIVDQMRLGTDPPPATWGAYADREWARALDWLDLSGLAIYFLQRMEESNRVAALPAPVRSQLERRRSDNRVRTAGILEELRRLTSSFQHSGVRYAVLKGIALAPDYCPDPAWRTQYDHDLLLPPRSLGAAEIVLRAAGYRRKNDPSPSVVVYRRPEPRIRFRVCSEGLYSSRLERSIELHLSLWERAEDKVRIDLPGDFIERSRPYEWDGIRFTALSEEDCLLFQVLHAFRHILRNWCRLSILLEMARFIERRSEDTGFWDRFGSRIESIRWAREACLLVFGLADRLFGSGMPPLGHLLTTRLTPAVELWIRRYGQRSAMANFQRDKSSLFLHAEFVESRAQWAEVRRRRLLPVQRPHRPPAVIFQRGFSATGRVWMETLHSARRVKFHSLAGLAYFLEYPRWVLLRRLRPAASSHGT